VENEQVMVLLGETILSQLILVSDMNSYNAARL